MKLIKETIKSYLLEKSEEMYKVGTQVQQFDQYGLPLKKNGEPVIRICVDDEDRKAAMLGYGDTKYKDAKYVSINICRKNPKEYVPLDFLKEEDMGNYDREFSQELYDFLKPQIRVYNRKMFNTAFANIAFNDCWDSLGATKKFLVSRIINCFEDEIKSKFGEISAPTMRLTVKKLVSDLRKENGIKEVN